MQSQGQNHHTMMGKPVQLIVIGKDRRSRRAVGRIQDGSGDTVVCSTKTGAYNLREADMFLGLYKPFNILRGPMWVVKEGVPGSLPLDLLGSPTMLDGEGEPLVVDDAVLLAAIQARVVRESLMAGAFTDRIMMLLYVTAGAAVAAAAGMGILFMQVQKLERLLLALAGGA